MQTLLIISRKRILVIDIGYKKPDGSWARFRRDSDAAPAPSLGGGGAIDDAVDVAASWMLSSQASSASGTRAVASLRSRRRRAIYCFSC